MSTVSYESLKTLKATLNEGVVSDNLFIFVWEDNPFLVLQYANRIAKLRNLSLDYVDSFSSLYSEEEDLFGLSSSVESIKVFRCDKFECPQGFDLSKLKNTIIICKDINLENEFVYRFPKLEDWEIIAYMKSQCKGLTDDEVKWLHSISSSLGKNNENIYRLDNEMKKLKCFDVSEQEQVFKELSNANGYCDLSPLTIFNFTNAILKKDKVTIMNVLDDLDSIDVEGVGLITILHKNFKQLIDVQMGKMVTPESLGLSPKQFNAIKYNCNRFSSETLIKVFKFLTELDYKLKSGQLELSNQRMIDYIVCSVLSL